MFVSLVWVLVSSCSMDGIRVTHHLCSTHSTWNPSVERDRIRADFSVIARREKLNRDENVYICTHLYRNHSICHWKCIVTICWSETLDPILKISYSLVTLATPSNDVAFSVFDSSLSPKSSNQSRNFKHWRISSSRRVLNLENDRWFDNHFPDLVSVALINETFRNRLRFLLLQRKSCISNACKISH